MGSRGEPTMMLRVANHVIASAGVAAGGTVSDAAPRTHLHVTGGSTHAGVVPIRPLSQSQIERFCRDGHLVLHISELPDELHARIYEHGRINQKGSVFTPGQRTKVAPATDALMPELTHEQREMFRQDFAAVSQSPTILGAMYSLLGPDFVGTVDQLQGASPSPDIASLPFALVSTTGDNQHHKDGTGLPVREHRFRSIGYWYVSCDRSLPCFSLQRDLVLRRRYYPHEVTVEMGPSANRPFAIAASAD